MPLKMQIGLARFPYSGNGGYRSVYDKILDWWIKTILEIKADPRCEDKTWSCAIADTPITMCRNMVCQKALADGVDVLVMLDSDQAPDELVGADAYAKPFFSSSLDFLWDHYHKGPCIICAPYCGPPPSVRGGEENVYVFKWAQTANTDYENRSFRLQQFGREEAAKCSGFMEIAAGATGLIMIDMRVFDELPTPWFYYEYENKYESKKASTEDVVFTRNASLHGCPVYCNWDSWAGHVKPLVVTKPFFLSVDGIREEYRKAVLRDFRTDERMVELNPGKSLEELGFSEGDIVVEYPNSLEEPELDGTVSVCHHTDELSLEKIAQLAANKAKTIREGNGHGGTITLVELGCWVGQSAIRIHNALRKARVGTFEIHCVDWFKGSEHDHLGDIAATYGSDKLWQTFWKNVNSNIEQCDKGKLLCHRMSTHDAASKFPDNSIDILFVDAGHSAEDVLSDLIDYLPKMRHDGRVIFHDYATEQFPGLTEVVDHTFGTVVKAEHIVAWVDLDEDIIRTALDNLKTIEVVGW